MISRTIILTVFLTVVLYGVSAQKQDYRFRTGSKTPFNPLTIGWPSTIYDYHFDSLDIKFNWDSEINFFRAGATATDSFGNILAAFNGYALIDVNGKIFEDGFKIAEDESYNDGRGPYLSTSMPQSMFFLEQPDNPNMLYLFYPYCPKNYESKITELRCSVLDLQDPENPILMAKDSLLGTPIGSAAGTVKHANGRDWWIIAGDGIAHSMHRWLLEPTGLNYVGEQQIDGIPMPPHSTMSPAFTPIGDKVVFHLANNAVDTFNYVQYYNFDRCTGLVSDAVHYDMNETLANYPDTLYNEQFQEDEYYWATVNWFTGATFSPSGKMLYYPLWLRYLRIGDGVGSSRYGLLQFRVDSINQNLQIDTVDMDQLWNLKGIHPNSPGQIVAWRRAFRSPIGTMHFAMEEQFQHIVHEPDSVAPACDLENYAINYFYDNYYVDDNGGQQPLTDTFYTVGIGLPYTINYRLYDEQGSTCDTLGIDGPPLAARFKWFPSDLEVQFQDRSFQDHDEWYWEFGDGSMGTAKHPQHTYPQPGTYAVCLNISRGDTISSLWCDDIEVFGPVSIDETHQSDHAFTIFPNPGITASKAIWSSDATLLKHYSIEGRLLESTPLSLVAREVLVRRPFYESGYSVVVLENKGQVVGKVRIFWE